MIMKKIIGYLLIALPFLYFLTACGSDDKNENGIVEKKTEEKYKDKIIGVWRVKQSTELFLSFSKDMFYTAYIDEYTLDDGDYSIVDNRINISRSYLGYNTTIQIVSLENNILTCVISYMSLYDDIAHETQKRLVLSKTEETPSVKQNKLIGKSFKTYSPYDKGMDIEHTVVAHNFITYNAKTHGGTIVKFPGTEHYIYLHPKIYYTAYKNGAIFRHYWLDTVNAWNVTIDNDNGINVNETTIY